MFKTEPGWTGAFWRETAPGAYPNGSRVTKVASDPSDENPIGAQATVLGSITHPEAGPCYFVEWDTSPRAAVFVAGKKLALSL